VLWFFSWHGQVQYTVVIATWTAVPIVNPISNDGCSLGPACTRQPPVSFDGYTNRRFEQRLSFQPRRSDPAAISSEGGGIVLENFVINIYIFKNREKIF
jgi:hypothetical protein